MRIEITIPESLDDITLKQYQVFSKLEEPTIDQTLTTFLNISQKELNMLPADKIEGFAEQINSVFEQDKQFTPTFILNGVKYGFIPKLDSITYGENKDLTTYLNDFDNMHKAMAVMYRPITHEQRGKYLIEDYEGSAKYSEVMKQAPLSVVLGATVFFLQFNERIAESYPELFGGGVGEGVKGFAKKWGNYEEAVALADEKVQRIIGVEIGTPVSRYPLHACYLYLAYLKDKTEFENRKIKKSFNN